MGCIYSKGAKDVKIKDKLRKKIKCKDKASSMQFVAPLPSQDDDNFDGDEKLGNGGQLDAPEWPSWLASVAGEAVKGWKPRRSESFEKLGKIGEGTYSSVYKAHDLETGKIVAMKKVRFVNMDPESVRFMAREIIILRKLDHPNVMKLEGIVASKTSRNLYLVFEYMEHDLAGLAATPGMNFTEPQIKCYTQQLFRGVEHCHSHGVLHRDIKGSNLLIDDNGVLKIADFGLATIVEANLKQQLTNRVVTLWYRAPELLLGATDYGVGVDLWSLGCIVAELFAGKPIMPGRTEVEQMHKIFKLCGSPSEEYWQKTKLPHATSFKPQKPYKCRIAETFRNFPPSALSLVEKLLSMEPKNRGTVASALKSQFFKTEPLPCDPSSLAKYPPSKELDIKHRDHEARRTETIKGRGPASVRRGSRDFKAVTTPEFLGEGQSNGEEDSTGNSGELSRQMLQTATGSLKQGDRASSKGYASGYAPRGKKIQYSGPVMTAGGNIEDMLKEHERRIQQAVRKARNEK
ncbi:putative serine/threonine-protein kinase [Hibiscus syriacus]|uniref:Serine/threonine-protein kinase n=1 Tax=Hibiscus syriacus TaxID=106335 RepID=A0A6A3D0U9_HIBSY|nr:putative serine/threonine-protein kinase [Hibiscus syriacus]